MEEQEQYSRSVKDYLSILWRRRLYVLIPFILLLAITIPIILSLQAIFTSTGTVLIESQQIPEDLVQSTVTGYADERLQVISQRVMTTQKLFSVIEKFNLYASQISTTPRSTIVSDMRKRISIERVNAEVKNQFGRKTEALIAFKVSFEHLSPNIAQRVTNELITLFLQENIRERTQQAKEATQFLQKEADRLTQAIEKSEVAIANYKAEYKDSLPDNLQNMTRQSIDLESRISDANFKIETIRNNIKLLKLQLEQAKSNSQQAAETITPETQKLLDMQQQLIALTSRYGEDHPDVKAKKREMEIYRQETGAELDKDSLSSQLTQLQDEYQTLLKKYAPAHPDAVRKKKQIEQLESRIAALPDKKTAPSNQADIQNINNQIAAANNDIGLQQQNLKALKAEKSLVDNRLEQIPQVERALESLNRDYQGLLAKYQDIHTKQQQAELARALEEDQKAERFTVLEPPNLPSAPSKPNRKKLVMISFALSLGAGLGLALLMEIANGAIRGPGNLAHVAGMEPLIEIPYIETNSDRKKRRRNLQIMLISLLLSLVLFLVLIHFFYKPLDLIFELILTKINIA